MLSDIVGAVLSLGSELASTVKALTVILTELQREFFQGSRSTDGIMMMTKREFLERFGPYM